MRSRALRPRTSTQLLVYGLLGLAVLIVVFPLVWMLGTAVKSNGQILDLNASLWPHPFEWGNIVKAWDSAPFGRWFLNSVIFGFGSTIGQIITSLLAGYAFAVFEFPGKRILFYAVLCGLMVPFSTVIVPVVQILGTLHWLNTYQGLLVPNLASALGAFLFRQFFQGLPPQLAEAARIDGASEFRIFLRVYVPLSRPIVAAFGMIAFLQNWNNFLFPLIVVNSTKMDVLSEGLSVFQGQFSTSYNLMMSAALIAILPILLVAVVAQRQIVEGITLGAIQ
ncbi:MAG TPA: carbohydrate ABC transporter permease [Solirubrobacteraceae bacterium]|nr:carbohydrate ABC transporter permease [Solirubrobacteraceae bacterium]